MTNRELDAIELLMKVAQATLDGVAPPSNEEIGNALLSVRAHVRRSARLREEVKRLRAWVDDLQSENYVNCVYCGHRYGPANETPTSKAEVLTRHVEKCRAHPMHRLRVMLRAMATQSDPAPIMAEATRLNPSRQGPLLFIEQAAVCQSIARRALNPPKRQGTCCECGQSGSDDTCVINEDGNHCEHWWDGYEGQGDGPKVD